MLIVWCRPGQGCYSHGGTRRALHIAMRFWSAIVISVWLLRGAIALACGAVPNAYWTLGAPETRDVQSIPTDAALVLPVKAWTEIEPHRSGAELIGIITVTVFDAAGSPVSGLLEPWYTGAGPALAWHPRVPLPANAKFVLKATVTQSEPRPASAIGETNIEFAFGTSMGPAPALRLGGPLQIILETYDRPLVKACNDCGTGCTPDGSARTLRARVTIPSVDGGHTPDTYAVWSWLANDMPHELPDGRRGTLINLGNFTTAERGKKSEILFDIPEEDAAYAPCFSLRVSDPAGHFVDAEPVCLARQDIKATIRALDAPAPSSGCDASRGSHNVGWLWAMGLALSVGGLRRRAQG